MTQKLLSVLLVLFFCWCPVARADDLLAPVYPGAVPFDPGKPGHFLSKDSYDQVKAFYLQNRDKKAARETVHPEMGRRAFIEYMDVRAVQQYDPVGSAIGVHLYSRNPAPGGDGMETAWPHVGDVFGNLKGLVMQGSLSPEEYRRLVERYRPVASCYFPLSSAVDPDGPPVPMDKVIYQRYQKGAGEQTLEQDAEAMAGRVQELMAQGRQREAIAMMQQIGQTAQKAYAQGIGPEGVEKWKACLAELEANGYRTKIEIARNPAGN